MEDSKDSGSKMNMSQLQAINRIKYALPTNLNVVERRQNKVNFADQNTYTSAGGSEIVVRLQASTDYIYGKNSYIVMDVQATAGASGGAVAVNPIGFLHNTACSLFDRVLFEDRSGAELERNDNLNAYCAQVLPLHWSKDYSFVGPAIAGQFNSGENGYSIVDTVTGIPSPDKYHKNGRVDEYDININSATGSSLTVVIPLRWILGVFNNETLIPSMLTSGSLIRLRLAPAARALERLSGTEDIKTATYTISNPRIVCDSLSLSPVVQKNLMEQSQAGGGLDYTYETVYYQPGNPLTNKNFNLQVNKAVSRCQKLYWAPQLAPATVPDSVLKNNLGTSLCKISQLDYRLGDMFFPQRVIDVNTPASKNGAELYENTLQSIHRMKTNVDAPCVDKFQFLVSGNAADNTGKNVHCQSFEMSSALEYSGLAINNSRTLEARINFEDEVARQITAWICYLKLAKCNQLRAIIKE